MTVFSSVTVPINATRITSYQYSLCPITSIAIPTSVTTINQGAFEWTLLASITIPTSVTSIGTIIILLSPFIPFFLTIPLALLLAQLD